MSVVQSDNLYRAQFGEDRILWQVFQKQANGIFIEVGAYDGVTLSNTYFLEQMGWSGILVEPIYPLCEKAAVARPNSRIVHAAISKSGSNSTATFTVTKNVPVLSYLNADQDHVDRCLREGAELVEIEVPVITLDEVILDARKNPGRGGNAWIPNRGWSIDLISIDVEGCELDVLDGLSLDRFKPRVLVMENDRPSGDSVEPYLIQRGYRKFHRQKINDFYARTDLPDGQLKLQGFELPPE